ncbi:hypothetical protein EFP02_05940 [Lactiplantibacillus plantarum]|nr:hypothetical protein [Lactiplantibacillus plantarum]
MPISIPASFLLIFTYNHSMKDAQYDSNQPNNPIKTSNRSGTEKSALLTNRFIKKDVAGQKTSNTFVLV